MNARPLLFLAGAFVCCLLARTSTSDPQAFFDLAMAGVFVWRGLFAKGTAP